MIAIKYLQLIGLFFALALSSCSSRSPKTPQADQVKPPLYHVIKSDGETVAIIAKWYTGEVKNWKEIVKVNPRLDPANITVGDSIMIPGDLIHIREEMPKEFLNSQLVILSNARKAREETENKNRSDGIGQGESSLKTPPQPELSPATEELIKTRDDLWKELMGE